MSPSWISLTCHGCGQSYSVRPSKATRSRYCSTACSYPNTIHKKGRLLGERHWNWKGGRVYEHQGYVMLRAPDHPNAKHMGYVLEHRLVMEQILGRYLLPSESVHHKNGIRDDNRPENLELWTRPQLPGIRATEAPHCPTCRCGELPSTP